MKKNALIPQWVHALTVGTHHGQNGSVTITDEHLQQIADTYSADLHEAPAVLGHPKTDDPAYGWVRSAEVRADGLWLNSDLAPELAEAYKQRRYSKVSVSLYPPTHQSNPTRGKYHLKHLGFLGAQVPAVKGLKPLALSESDDTITIEFSQEKEPIMDPKITAAQPTATAPAASTADLAEQEKGLKAREVALAERERKLRRQELDAKLEPHVSAGRLLPAHRQLFVELMERVDGQEVSLSEGSAAEPLVDQLNSYLGKLAPQVNLSEVSAPYTPPGSPSNVVSFSAPEGFQVDQTHAELHNKVQAWLSQNPGKTYVEAITALGVA